MAKHNQRKAPAVEQPSEHKTPPGSCDIIILDNGGIALQFGEVIRHMVFTPELAKKLGISLIEAATRGESLQRIGQTAKGKH